MVGRDRRRSTQQLTLCCLYMNSQTHNSRSSRPARWRSVLAAAFGLAFTAAPSPAQWPLAPGAVVVTCFADAAAPHVAMSMDLRNPPAGATGGAVWNNFGMPPGYTGPAVPNDWTLAVFGGNQVFGVALDDASPPNVFFSTTGIYLDGTGNPQTRPPNPARIFRADGLTGRVTAFADIPGAIKPASLGNICYESARRRLFVSDLDTGIIWAVSAAGVPTQFYDHGTQGRLRLAGRAALADTGTPGHTAFGRLVWGLQVFNGRLYYGVAEPAGTAWVNEIWSAGIVSATGAADVLPGSPTPPRREVDFTGRMGQGFPVANHQGARPMISDIAFSRHGEMLAAERTVFRAASGGAMIITSSAHDSGASLYRQSAAGTWVLRPGAAGQPPIGDIRTLRNSAGGADFDCAGNYWVTGDFHTLTAPGTNWFRCYGAGHYLAPNGATDYYIDYDNNANTGDKYQVGDVAAFNRCCIHQVATQAQCEADGTYRVRLTLRNQAAWPMAKITFPNLPAGVTASPREVLLDPAIRPGEVGTVEFVLSGAQAWAGRRLCMFVAAHSPNPDICCAEPLCFDLPACCVFIRNEVVTCTPNGTFQFSFQWRNNSGLPIRSFTFSPRCGTLTPGSMGFDPPVAPNDTTWRTITLSFTPAPGCPDLTFDMIAWDDLFRECCRIPVQRVLPRWLWVADPIGIGSGTVVAQGEQIPVTLLPAAGEEIVGIVRVFISNNSERLQVAVFDRLPASFTLNFPAEGYWTLEREIEFENGVVDAAAPLAVFAGQTLPPLELLAPNTSDGGPGLLALVFAVPQGFVGQIEQSGSLDEWAPVQQIYGDGREQSVLINPNQDRALYRLRLGELGE